MTRSHYRASGTRFGFLLWTGGRSSTPTNVNFLLGFGRRFVRRTGHHTRVQFWGYDKRRTPNEPCRHQYAICKDHHPATTLDRSLCHKGIPCFPQIHDLSPTFGCSRASALRGANGIMVVYRSRRVYSEMRSPMTPLPHGRLDWPLSQMFVKSSMNRTGSPSR